MACSGVQLMAVTALHSAQLGHLQLELGNQKLAQESRLAEVEGEYRQLQEEAEQKVSVLPPHLVTEHNSSPLLR